MKLVHTFALLCMIANHLFAQSAPKNLYQSWVSCKITYKDGSPLPDDNVQKYMYMKYTFSKPDNFNLSTINYELGTTLSFEMDNKMLILKTPEGGFVNSFKIKRWEDTLILQAAGRKGFESADALLYYFVPERMLQNALPLQPDDIFSVKGKDTVYKEGKKVHAVYTNSSFTDDLYKGVKGSMEGRSGHLTATFLVNKKGFADSLRILEGIDADYDAHFVKSFNSTKRNWKSATLNGQPVAVQMLVQLRYYTSATILPAYLSSQKAKSAYQQQDYELALYYYDEALKSEPADKESLCQRGLCKLKLGNQAGACADWNAAKALGSTPIVDNLIQKFCATAQGQ